MGAHRHCGSAVCQTGEVSTAGGLSRFGQDMRAGGSGMRSETDIFEEGDIHAGSV